MCDTDSVHIWLIDGAVRAIVSVKSIRSTNLVAVYQSTHLAVADSLCGEGDRAAANVDCLAAHLPPSSSDWLQSSGAALHGWPTPHRPSPSLETHSEECWVYSTPGTSCCFLLASASQSGSCSTLLPPLCRRMRGSWGCLPGAVHTSGWSVAHSSRSPCSSSCCYYLCWLRLPAERQGGR